MSLTIENDQRRMAEIAEKVENGERLSLQDGLFFCMNRKIY